MAKKDVMIVVKTYFENNLRNIQAIDYKSFNTKLKVLYFSDKLGYNIIIYNKLY